MYCIDKLRFIQLLARKRYDTIDLGYHVDSRCILILASYLYQVVHVVAEETAVSGHVCAIAFTDLELINLKEMLVGRLNLTLLHKLIVVHVREQYRFVGIIKREAESAFGSNISELLIKRFVPVKCIHILLHIDLRIAAFPSREVLQMRPIIFRKKLAIGLLLKKCPQFVGASRIGFEIGLEFFANLGLDMECF